jgi:hypothetical protein
MRVEMLLVVALVVVAVAGVLLEVTVEVDPEVQVVLPSSEYQVIEVLPIMA